MKAVAVGLALAAFAGPVAAQTWPEWSSEFYGVAQATTGDRSCMLISDFEFEGRSNVMLAMAFREDYLLFGLFNGGWSAISADEPSIFGLAFSTMGEEPFIGPGVGAEHRYRNGFFARFDAAAAERFAASDFVMVFRGDEETGEATLVAELPLEGSADAVSALRRCHAYAERQRVERAAEEARYNHVPSDPFAD